MDDHLRLYLGSVIALFLPHTTQCYRLNRCVAECAHVTSLYLNDNELHQIPLCVAKLHQLTEIGQYHAFLALIGAIFADLYLL